MSQNKSLASGERKNSTQTPHHLPNGAAAQCRAHNLHISPHSIGRDDVTEHRISRIYRISVFYTKLQKQGAFAKKVSVFKRKPSILVKKLYICLG